MTSALTGISKLRPASVMRTPERIALPASSISWILKAFATQEDVFAVAEEVLYDTFTKFSDKKVTPGALCAYSLRRVHAEIRARTSRICATR